MEGMLLELTQQNLCCTPRQIMETLKNLSQQIRRGIGLNTFIQSYMLI